jgi:phosphate/sulfate permease
MVSRRNRVVAVSFLSIVLSSAIVVATATALALPVATHHAVIGALLSVLLFVSGPQKMIWNGVRSIGFAWLLSPVMGAGFALIVRYGLDLSARSHAWYMFILPLMSSITICGMMNVLFFSGPKILLEMLPRHWMVLAVEVIMFVCVFTLTATFMRRNAGASVVSQPVYNLADEEDLEEVESSIRSKGSDTGRSAEFQVMDVPLLSGDALEADAGLAELADEHWASTFVMDEQAPIFRVLLAATAIGVAFADGSNVTGNTMAPFMHVLRVYLTGELGSVKATSDRTSVLGISGNSSVIIVLIGAAALVCGLVLWGHRVTQTMGKMLNRNTMTLARAFSAQLATALSVLVATALHIPLSTSHCAVTAIAVSSVCCVPASERARDGLDFRLLSRIALVAILTPLVSAIVAVALYICIGAIF